MEGRNKWRKEGDEEPDQQEGQVDDEEEEELQEVQEEQELWTASVGDITVSVRVEHEDNVKVLHGSILFGGQPIGSVEGQLLRLYEGSYSDADSHSQSLMDVALAILTHTGGLQPNMINTVFSVQDFERHNFAELVRNCEVGSCSFERLENGGLFHMDRIEIFDKGNWGKGHGTSAVKCLQRIICENASGLLVCAPFPLNSCHGHLTTAAHAALMERYYQWLRRLGFRRIGASAFLGCMAGEVYSLFLGGITKKMFRSTKSSLLEDG
jgi:hypothetical protein